MIVIDCRGFLSGDMLTLQNQNSFRRFYMFRSGFASKMIVVVSCLFAFSSLANAQATRTWVSGVGDDVNPCSRTAPCKTFAGAISKTAVNGEINCLDPGGFGSVTITKSIMIDCTGTLGGILAAGTNGVIVNITSATDTKKAVKLRGLDINGAATGINGVRILAANSVIVEDSAIDGFTQHGISVETTSGTPRIVVNNANIRSNVGNGINTFIIGGTVSLTVSNSRLMTSATGLNLSNNTKAAIKSSTVSGNTTGVVAAQAELGVSDCVISHNTTGVSAVTGGTIRLTGNIVTGNTTGLSTSGGTIVSYGNNMRNGNVTDGSPTSTIALQ